MHGCTAVCIIAFWHRRAAPPTRKGTCNDRQASTRLCLASQLDGVLCMTGGGLSRLQALTRLKSLELHHWMSEWTF